MVNSLMALPGYQVFNPWDATPVANALDSNARMAQQNYQFGQQNKLAQANHLLAQRQDQRQQSQFDTQQQAATVQRFAGHAQSIDGLKDPGQRKAAWDRLLASHPNAGSLPLEYWNPETGPRMLMQEAQGFMGREDQAKLRLMQAQTGLYSAQARASGQKSEMEGAIADMIRGSMGGGQPPPAAPPGPQPPMVQRQSFGGPGPQSGVMPAGGAPQAAQGVPGVMPPQGDPNFILAQAAGGQPQPQQPAAPDLGPGQDMVDTPMGRMPRQRAQQLGFALALGGKGDAGKMMGDAAGQGMPGKEARNEIEKKLFAATEQRARLTGIQSKFKPEWQTLDEQLKQYGLSWMDSIGPLRNKIPPQERARMAEYAQYRQDAFQNINMYIKEITGAQMSEAEASRLRKASPDPEKDSPTQFQSKMDNLLAQTDLARARYNYLLRRGFQGSAWESGITVEQMQGIVNERGRQVEGLLRSVNPNLSDEAVKRGAYIAVKQEFGI